MARRFAIDVPTILSVLYAPLQPIATSSTPMWRFTSNALPCQPMLRPLIRRIRSAWARPAFGKRSLTSSHNAT